MDPDHGSRLYYEGSELLRRGSPAEALPLLLKSLLAQPHGVTAKRIATALEELHRQSEADEYWRRGFELAP